MDNKRVVDESNTHALGVIGGFTRSVGVEGVKSEAGIAELLLDIKPEHLNSGGIVHGGVLATLLDCAGGAAVFSVLPATQFAPTTNMSINYMSSVSEGRLIARSNVLKQGRRMVYCESKVYCDDKLLASAQLSFMVMNRIEPLNNQTLGDTA